MSFVKLSLAQKCMKNKSGHVIEHVIVQGRDLYVIVAQSPQHRIDFIGGQDEISGDRGLSFARGGN